jgi:Holliday junction DNA helicase RuvA
VIDYIHGSLVEKNANDIVIEVSGIGYKVSMCPISIFKLPKDLSPVKIYIVEAVAGMYGGVINLYGFLTKEEREMFVLIKDKVSGTGAKKALEYLNKISKSLIDFKTAIVNKNGPALQLNFGFSKKTADKLIASLKDKMDNMYVETREHFTKSEDTNTLVSEAIMALVSLGVKEAQARAAVDKALASTQDMTLENLIRASLKFVGDI